MGERNHRVKPGSPCRDGLTGLYNHGEFDQRLNETLARCRRYNRVFSMFMLDIDHFCTVNESFGRATGDRVLLGVADIIRTTTRGPDLVARYEDDAFAVILPETTRPHACIATQRVLEVIGGHAFGVENRQPLKITVSIGTASFPDDADSQEGLIVAADRALSDAKRAGRNCVYSCDPTRRMEFDH